MDKQEEKADQQLQEQVQECQQDLALLVAVREKYSTPELTDIQIKQLAREMLKNEIFTSLQIKNPQDIGMVFMPLIFLIGEEPLAGKIFTKEQTVFYEYYNKAGPSSINGMPIFMSFRTVRYSCFKKALKVRDRMQEMLDGINPQEEK